MPGTLLSLGHGYCAAALGRLLAAEGWRVVGTTRSERRARALRAAGVDARPWPGSDLSDALAEATHVLSSVPPAQGGDPVLAGLGERLAASRPEWVGYLSTTAVYGDRPEGWVDESTPPAPGTARGRLRVEAEAGWRALGLPLHVFRLAGIYGPGRGPLAKLRAGTARRIARPGQVFGRIHVEDAAAALRASIARPDPGAVYNLCDDEPAPPQDVIAFAAGLLGAPLPPEEDFAAAEMTPMARSFYSESKWVRNDRIKSELGVRLAYPTYREGLAALARAEGAEGA